MNGGKSYPCGFDDVETSFQLLYPKKARLSLPRALQSAQASLRFHREFNATRKVDECNAMHHLEILLVAILSEAIIVLGLDGVTDVGEASVLTP